MTDNHTRDISAEQLEAGRRLNELYEDMQAQRYPPVHDWEPDLCGDIDIRITRDGRWFYMGTPINRPEMVRLFSTVLRHDDDGYYLVTPVEKLKIQVDDAPYLAVSMAADGVGEDQVLSFHMLTGDLVIADADHPIWVTETVETKGPSPYILVRDRLEALIARPVYYEMVERSTIMPIDGKDMAGVWSSGTFFPLGHMDEED